MLPLQGEAAVVEPLQLWEAQTTQVRAIPYKYDTGTKNLSLDSLYFINFHLKSFNESHLSPFCD